MVRKVKRRLSDGRPSVARLLIVLAIVVVGVADTSFSVAQYLRTQLIGVAASLAPYDGRLLALRSKELAGPNATSADRHRAGELARLALRRDAMAVPAYTTLGLNMSASGDITTARQLFLQSERLSRRDFTTQLWGIEDTVAQGDYYGALQHYDVALRTQSTASEILFPILTNAVSSSDVRRATAELLKSNPFWATSFVQSLAATAPDLDAVRQLFLMLHSVRFTFPEGADASLTGRIVSAGKPDTAWLYYQTIRPEQARALLRNGNFQENVAIPGPFDWVLRNDDQSTATMQGADNGGVLIFDAMNNVNATIIRQILHLKPGRYRLVSKSGEVTPTGAAAPFWQVTCLAGEEIGKLPLIGRTAGSFDGTFEIPRGCSFQTLSLQAQANYAPEGTHGIIESVRLYSAA